MPWTCQNCNAEIWSDKNMVILDDKLWLSIANEKDVLCDTCIEKKLGRKIERQDLIPNVMCNVMYMYHHPHLFTTSEFKFYQEQKKQSGLVEKIIKEGFRY
jgi:hypothetical protein